jgi:hypothetical protein
MYLDIFPLYAFLCYEVMFVTKLTFIVDCKRLGEAINPPERLHRSDGGGC